MTAIHAADDGADLRGYVTYAGEVEGEGKRIFEPLLKDRRCWQRELD